VALRGLPAVAGALLIPVFYLFLRQLGASRRISTLGASLLLLENAILVESRFILIDSMLLLFGLSAVTAFLASRRASGRRCWILLAVAALCAGLAASTKWTGLTALGLIGLIWIYDQIRARKIISKPAFAKGFILLAVPAVVYLSVFWIHFQLLPKTGQGDAFMPQRFQETLVGNPSYNPSVHLGFWEKFVDLNREMSASEESLKTATHPYGSKWYTWPVMLRPIYYWQSDQTAANGAQGNIYLTGNPVVWWGIIIVLLAGAIASTQALKRLKPYRFALTILAIGYCLNFLPFSGIVRVMFLYHYFFALIYSLAFAVILLGAQADWTADGPHPWQFQTKTSRNLYIGVLATALIGFIYFAPLSYGVPLTPAQLAQHMWLKTWR
jgi:dolichyl-phosphate-mannose-protein mannosyltransferase